MQNYLDGASARFGNRYENAQNRILDVFRRWEAPVNFKIEPLQSALPFPVDNGHEHWGRVKAGGLQLPNDWHMLCCNTVEIPGLCRVGAIRLAKGNKRAEHGAKAL